MLVDPQGHSYQQRPLLQHYTDLYHGPVLSERFDRKNPSFSQFRFDRGKWAVYN
jgi:hypothetical protein